MPTTATVRIADLRIDQENPRLDEQTNQRDAIRAIAADQKGKLVALARDIVAQKGLNPLDRLLVMQAPNGTYTVLEGNRRVAALKVLDDPSIVDGAIGEGYLNHLKKLSAEYRQDPVIAVDVAIAPDRKAATHWLRLRHTGQNKGAGVVPWNGNATANFRSRFEVPPAHVRVYDFLVNSPSVSAATKARLSKLGITNLERLINDPYVRGRIGLDIERGTRFVRTKHTDEEIASVLETVVYDFTVGGKSVSDIKQKGQRKSYIDGLSSTLPDPKYASGIPRELGKVGPASRPTKSDRSSEKLLPSSLSRPTLIPKGCRLKIKVVRINDVYHELRSLQVEEFANSCAVLLRVFLELSLDEYASCQGVDVANKWDHRTSLVQKMIHVEAFMQKNKVLSKNQLGPFRKASSAADDLSSPNTLNGYVHNRRQSPLTSDLKATWNNLEIVFEKIWT